MIRPRQTTATQLSPIRLMSRAVLGAVLGTHEHASKHQRRLLETRQHLLKNVAETDVSPSPPVANRRVLTRHGVSTNASAQLMVVCPHLSMSPPKHREPSR